MKLCANLNYRVFEFGYFRNPYLFLNLEYRVEICVITDRPSVFVLKRIYGIFA
jgi:hypothetical protein